MNKISIEQFEQAIKFSDKIVSEIYADFKKLLDFLKEFKAVYDKEFKKLPYHINLIDELHANENAHSRILVKLLNQKDPINKKHEILENFIQFIIEKYSEKDEFQKIKIINPHITQEIERIDLWIRDNHNYAIILENKVNNAIDQLDGIKVKGGQIERYINKTKDDRFEEEQIYVLYLPPTYEKEPSKESWGKYFETDIHRTRYLNISFKDDILPWLINSVLPNIRLKDKYLSSAVEQYIDHLEGKFSLRTTNNKMNMVLQEFIKKELGINGIEPVTDLEIILGKKNDLQNALNQLSELEKKVKIEHFPKWEKQLAVDFKEHKEAIVSQINTHDILTNVGIKFSYNEIPFTLLIEYKSSNNAIYYGIAILHTDSKSKRDIPHFDEIIKDLKLQVDEDKDWYAWEYTSFSEAYMRLKILIEKTENLKNNDHTT